MATITTDEQFVSACNHLIAANLLPVQGDRFIDRAARQVWDERIGGNVDITPDTATLEAALDAAIATLTAEQTKAVARQLMLSDAKNYLSNQLQAANPNVANIYTTIRAYVADNAILTQMVTNQITVAQTAFGWSLNLTTPTATDRMRYIVCIQLVIATIA
jgi:hypothetical protein